MSEIDNSRESFNAASDANDSLEPGELKLTPPRSSPIPHDVTRDQKRSSVSSLEILKNYQSDHDDLRKDNEDEIVMGNGKYYDNKRNFHNNRRSPINNQRFFNNYNPNFRNRNFKNRPGFNRGRGGFMPGRNRNFGYRNHFQPEHDFDSQKQNLNKFNLLSYTKTKPSISWRINENFKNFTKLEQNDTDKNWLSKKCDSESIKTDKFQKDKSDNSEIMQKVKHKKSKTSKKQRSDSKLRDINASRNKSKSSERSLKANKSEKRDKSSKINLNDERNDSKLSKKKKLKKLKRKYSRSDESEPKTPPIITKSATPEVKQADKLQESLESLDTQDGAVKSPIKNLKEQKLKHNISSGSISNKKSKKHNENFKRNKLNPHSLSFVDDLYGNDNFTDIFPLSKDETISTPTEIDNKAIKIKIENKSDSNSDSPDTDEYQDMWEEDVELINESADNRIIKTIKRPESIKKSKSIDEITNNLITNENLLQNIKIEKDDSENLCKQIINSELNNKQKKLIEDIFSENSKEPSEVKESDEEKDMKDGLGTPIFLNPSPPSDGTILPISVTPPSNVAVKIKENLSVIDMFQEDNDTFEPNVNPNKKLLFGMQDIYEQFLQSVTNAGIDISSTDNNIDAVPKQIKITKEIISPLELEATAPTISINIDNLPKSEPLTTKLISLHNEQSKTESEIPARLTSPSSSSTTSSSSSSSSSSSNSSDSSSTSTSTTSSTNSSDQKNKGTFEYLQLFSKEDKKQLRALQKRLETLKSWSAMDEDEQDCFQGLQKVLENEIHLLKRKYIILDNIEQKPEVPSPSTQAPSTLPKEVIIPKVETVEPNNKIFDSTRDVIKLKISPKVTNFPNKIWTLPIPQIFSIEQEIAKAKVAASNELALAAEAAEKSAKNHDKSLSEKKSKNSGSQSEHCSSSSRRSTRSPIGNRSPDKNHRDSNPPSSRSPGRDRRSRGSPHLSDNRKSSSTNHSLKSRRRTRHSRSRSHSPIKRFRGESPTRKTSRRRDTNKSFRESGSRGSFHRRSYSRSRSRSHSRSRFSRRRSISPYMSRRYSRSPPFRPPSPPPHKIRCGGSRDSTHSRSRSNSPQQQHIQRISPLPWTRDENNCSQYYDGIESYTSYPLSPNRSTLDNRINQELNIRPIGTTIPSYQSYTQFNSYNDYMPTMQINNTTGQFNNNPYVVGYQQPTNLQENLHEYALIEDYDAGYYYNSNNGNEYQETLNLTSLNRQNFKNDINIDMIDNDTIISDISIAVQKGNVLEIVPASILPNTDNLNEVKIKEENNKIDIDKQKFGEKKKIPVWKEEVNRRHVLCAVLKLNRESDGTMKSILIDNIPETSKSKEKKLVLFADGIRPGNGPSDEKSTVYKKEKKSRKSSKDKKKIINIVQDNKENENVKEEILNVDTKIDIQLENAPPPPPPPGSPPPYLPQPILIRKNSPEQLLYFHFDPVVNSMYVSQIPNAIPPRLLNRQNQPNVSNLSPGQLNIGNNSNGKSPSISSSPIISTHDKIIIPKIGLPRCDKFINSPRLPIPTVVQQSAGQTISGQFPTNTIGYHQRFHNHKNTSMSSCNFSMPPPSTNQQFQPYQQFQSRPPNLEQLKRSNVTLPFNPVVPPPIQPITDNTPAFSSDSTSSTSFFKNDNTTLIYPSQHIISNNNGQQFIRNDTKNLTNSYNITTVTSTP